MSIKIQLSKLQHQLEARRWLYHLRDPRVKSISLNSILVDAARRWPSAFPPRWKPRTILDIGAHRGDVARQFSILYHPEFIGMIEPLPEMKSVLESLQLSPHQRLFSCAVGDTLGEATLNILASAASSSLLEPSESLSDVYQRDMHTTERIKVPVRTLDDIFSECKLNSLDLLKVDVEGYELAVFAGGQETLKRTKIIVAEVVFFEAHKERPQFNDIYSALHGYGYELRALVGHVYDQQGLPLYCDGIFFKSIIL